MEGETRYARSGDLFIAYQVLGDGPIDLVFAPGYMSHLEQNQWWPPYKAFLDRIASFSRLLVFDRRGTGLSDRKLSIGAYAEMLDDIRAVMDAAGIGAGGAARRSGGRPDLRPLRRHVPRANDGARPRLVVRAAAGGRPTTRGGIDDETAERILVSYAQRWGQR